MSNLKYCSLCLATDVKMFTMNTSINKVYSRLLQLSPFKLVPYICYECAALLLKFDDFYAKCHQAHNVLTILKTHNSKLIDEALRKMDRKQYNLQSKLAQSHEIVNLELPGDYNSEQDSNSFLEVKVENQHEQVNEIEYQDQCKEEIIISEIKLEEECQEQNQECEQVCDSLLNETGNCNVDPEFFDKPVGYLLDSPIPSDELCFKSVEVSVSDQNSEKIKLEANIKPKVDNKKCKPIVKRTRIKLSPLQDGVINSSKSEIKLTQEEQISKTYKDEQIPALKGGSYLESVDYVPTATEGDLNDNDKSAKRKRSSEIAFNDGVIKCGTAAEISLYVSKVDSSKNVGDILPATDGVINKDNSEIKHKKIGRNVKGVTTFNADLYKDYITMVKMTPEEAKKEVILRKESTNFRMNTYKCDLCCKGFIAKSTFDNHMKRHKTGDLECEFCHLRFSKKNLSIHEMMCHIYKFTCKICSFVCFNSKHALSHINIHKGKKYSCEECGLTFKVRHTMNIHRLAKHPKRGNEFICEFCGTVFNTLQGLYVHNRVHPEEVNEGKGPNCEECGVQFATETAWKRHLVLSTKHVVTNGCKFCGEIFPTDIELRRHAKETHKYNKYNKRRHLYYRKPREDPAACEICNQPLATSSEYRSHVTSEHPFSDLARKIDAEQKKFMCEMCGKSFWTKLLLIDHLRTHTNERPFKCAECGKSFTSSTGLYNHKNTHRARNEYQCDTCKRFFASKPTLDKHMKTHLGIRPYKCDICEKTFINACEVKYHLKHTHNKVPWPKPNGKRSAKVRAMLEARAARQAGAGADAGAGASGTRANV